MAPHGSHVKLRLRMPVRLLPRDATRDHGKTLRLRSGDGYSLPTFVAAAAAAAAFAAAVAAA